MESEFPNFVSLVTAQKENWGDDVAEFRPECWLEADPDYYVIGPASEQSASEQKSGGDGEEPIRSYEMGITRDSAIAEVPFTDRTASFNHHSNCNKIKINKVKNIS